MRYIPVVIILFLFALQTQAQTDSFYVWNKWCARKDTLLLFNGGNNTISVYSNKLKPSEYKLKSLDRSLRIGSAEIHGDTMSVLAMPYPVKNKQMRLAILNARTLKVIKTVNFTSDSLPKPKASIGKIQLGESYKKTILTQTKLRVYFPNSLYSYPYTIKQYTFRCSTPKGNANIVVNSFFLNTLVLKEISEAPEGTVLEFTNIKALCPECAMRTLDDVHVKIK
jgi:hypothetical protein